MSRDILRGAAEQFQRWVKEQADKRNAPIVDAPKGRRDEFVDPYFKGAKPDQVVVILKAREPARIMTAIGDKKRKPLASPDRRPLGRAIQLLYQRPALGPDVRAHLPLPSVLRPGLPQSAPLAGQPHARGRHRFPAMLQCLPANAQRPSVCRNSPTP